VAGGTVSTVSGTTGYAVRATGGNDQVTNTGLMMGSIDLGQGGNAIDNKPNAVFDAGAVVNVGANRLFTNEGLVSPGAFANVLTTAVTGNFLQTGTAIYGVDLEFLNQTSDRINVSGTASITGAVNVNIMNPGLAVPGSHDTTILSAAGTVINHTGLALNFVPTAVAQYQLTYPNPNDVNLHYDINFSPGGLTKNQTSVGNAVNQIQTDRISPNFVPIAAALFYQPNVATLGRVYDSLSGEGTSGVEQTAFSSNTLFMNTIVHQMGFWLFDQPGEPDAVASTSDSVLSYAAVEPRNLSLLALKAMPDQPQRWRLWAEAYGVGASVNGDFPLGAARLNYSGGGFAMGADYRADRDTLLGFGVGAGLSSFSVPDRATSGDVDGGHIAAYGAKRWGSFYATGIIGYDFFHNEEKRFATLPGAGQVIVPVPGFAEKLRGSFFSQSLSTRVEIGWRTWFDHLAVTPFAALQYGLLGMNGYTETAIVGPSVLGLSYANRVVDSLPLFLGTQFDSKFEIASMPAAWWLRAAWVHEFESDRTINPSFLAAPGYDFVVNGATPARDAARFDAGLKLAVRRNAELFTTFNGEFSDKGKGSSYAGTGGLRISW